MKITSKAIALLVLVIILASCNSSKSAPQTSPTDAIETAISAVETEIVKTQEAMPTATATALQLPTGTPVSIIHISTSRPDQQVYIDPEGWYSVNFPANMKPTNKENRFFKEDSFFETGYLPEMGMMSRARNVCAWLANITEDGAEGFRVLWLPPYDPVKCSVLTPSDALNHVNYDVFENPSADLDHRFIYVKTGWSIDEFSTTFSWLKPTKETKFISQLSPLTPEEIIEWENIAPILQNVSVTEYELPSGSNPYQEMLLRSVPEEVLEKRRAEYSSYDNDDEFTLEEDLKSLGYELISDEWGGNRTLYRDGSLLFDSVFDISDVYSFSTKAGPLNAFLVIARNADGKYNRYLIQNDVINEWNYPLRSPPFAPVLYQGDLLWLETTRNSRIQVLTSSRDIIYSFASYREPFYSTEKFTTWDGHWIWAPLDFLIQDGEILNEKLGFQEIFKWRLIDGKPAYFFRKNGRVGFSYDGKIIPLEYQDIAHYMCCGYAANNPFLGDNSAYFFAEREGVWYYVGIDFR